MRCRFFTPDSYWSWYVVEAGRAEDIEGNADILFFGYVDGLENEFGYFSLNELRMIRGPMGLGIERDLRFELQPISRIFQPKNEKS